MGAFVTADGDTRIITVTKVPVGGLSSLDAQVDIYSDLKEDWLATPSLQGLKFPLRSFGDPKTPTEQIGPYMFLSNDEGWRLRPYDLDHELTINGNIVAEDTTLPLWLGRAGRSIVVLSEQSAQALTTTADLSSLTARQVIIEKLLRNKVETDPATGIMTVYEDDGTTPFMTAQMYEGITDVQAYQGAGAERRERLQ